MAAVFDLDLETEEGSEGEPEFSPSVSGPPGRGSILEPIPSLGGGSALASPSRCLRSLLLSSALTHPHPPRPVFQVPSPSPGSPFSALDLSSPVLAHRPLAPIPDPLLSWAK